MMDDNVRIHALDYLHVVRRRKWWLIGPMIASIAVGALLLVVLPKEFRATATMAVSAPAVSPSLVNQSGQFNDQDRLRAISQQLLGNTILSEVVAREEIGPAGDPRVIARLRDAITVTVPEPVMAVNEPRRLDSFLVSYRNADREDAQRIANRIVEVFIDASAKTRTAHAEGTSAFLASQVEASQRRLNELEGRLRKAKESYIGQLPEQTQANLSTLSGLRQQFETNAMALRGEQDRLSMVERQIQSIRNGDVNTPIVTSTGAQGFQTPESRASELQRELATARMTYTDKHPEVQRLQEELSSARQAAAEARQRADADAVPIDPAHRQLLADREMARLRARDLQRADVELRRQISAYQARVESAPMVEQQLAGMQRDYDLERQQYSDLSAKLHSATLAENVERNGNGEQFTLLYPAALPTAPVSPVPWRVMLVAIAAGIALGCAAAVVREYLDRSVHDVRDIKDELEFPVLGEVARIRTA